MPYCTPEERVRIRHGSTPVTEGQLAYKIWWEMRQYHQRIADGYAARIGIYGIVGGLAAEWYRRVVAPYEDQKIQENGDT